MHVLSARLREANARHGASGLSSLSLRRKAQI
jgi:hypothetical protein